MRIELPDSVKKIISILETHGHEAYAVGGCVRDSLLGKEPKDWDITTSARPEQVKELFYKTIDTGIQHGTVTVMMHHVGYEVTTYRIDGKYEDGRHPKEVIFTPSLEEDLKRRDFTINAMAYSDRTGIVDKFDGMADLQKKVIRCVGVPTERFTEDALRILRAVRFSAQLGFEIAQDTMEAVIRLAPSLKKISRERIQAELEKLLMSDHPDKVNVLRETGLTGVIFAECPKNDESEDEWDENALAGRLMNSEKNHYIRWSLFISYLPYKNILRSLKFDNRTIRTCEKYYLYRNEELSADKPCLRHLIVRVGKEIFAEYLDFRRTLGNVEKQQLEQVSLAYGEILRDKDCLSLKELAVNGGSLRKAGVEPGAEMGKILDKLFEMVLDNADLNDNAVLMEKVSEIRSAEDL